jgi:hypothetical protein
MLEGLAISGIFVSYLMAGILTFGPHQEAPKDCQKTAIVSERTGEVLYYNCK